MDFHSLSRKELQTLCKKNKIPANITNVAMADALSALPQVEGLDEFLNPTEAEAGAGTPDTRHRTACRTSTRRKALREEPQSSKVVSSQRLHRGVVVAEQENKDANVLPVTPAARRRPTAVSSRRAKKEPEMVEDDEEKNGDQGKPTDVPKTPAAVPSSRTRATGHKTEGTSVRRAYNTRRSVRLLEKNLSKMSLMETEEKIDDVFEEMSSISQQIEDSADTEEGGASLQTVSNVVSEETDEFEVSSLEKNTEYECQVHDSGSEVKLVCGAEIDVGAGLEAKPQEEDSKLEADSEPHDSNLKLEGSSGTHDDVDMNKSIGEIVHADNKAGAELLSEHEDSCDSSEAENKECLGTKQEALSVEASEDASMECDEQNVAALIVEVSEDASIEVTDQAVAALTVKVTEDASIEVTDQDIAALAVEVIEDASIEVTDQDVAGSLPISPASDESATLKEFLDCNTDQGSNDVGDNQHKNNETEHLNVADGSYIQHFEPMNDVDEKAADGKDLASPEGIPELGSSNACSSDEHQEEPEVKSENSKESLSEVEKMDIASDAIDGSSPITSEKDNAYANSANSFDVIEVCIESSADESTGGENFSFQSSLLDDHQEELEARSEHLEESMVGVEKVIDGASDVTGASSTTIALDKDASSENPIAVEVCTESSVDVKDIIPESSLVDVDVQEAEEEDASSENYIAVEVCTESSVDVKNITLESPLVDVDVQEAEEQKDNSDNLEAKAQPEESEVLSFNSNTLVEGGVISAEVVIPKQESYVSAETVTVAPINELKDSDIPMQSVVAETKGVANEIETVPKMMSVEDNMHNANMKENLTTDELNKKSIRELKMMLKKLTLVDDGKSTCKSNSSTVVKEVERKRTALKALPENQMTKGAQNEG